MAFQQLGIDPSAAPAAAVQLDNAEFCGWEDDGPSGNDQPNTDGRRCFVEAQFDGRSALYVWQVRTNEGDPLAVVYRTKGGAVSMYIDHTRDSLGTSGWEGGPCIGLTIETNGAFNPPLLQFHCTVPDPTTT